MADFLPAAVSAAVAARQITPQAGYLWCVLRILAGPDATPGVCSPSVLAPSDADLQRALGGMQPHSGLQLAAVAFVGGDFPGGS